MMGAAHAKWIKREDVDRFREFCESNGHATRSHTDPFRDGFQVWHKGHWMAVVWNRLWQRYTADRRLGLLVQSFAAQVAAESEQQ
jgi:hypothetical protein